MRGNAWLVLLLGVLVFSLAHAQATVNSPDVHEKAWYGKCQYGSGNANVYELGSGQSDCKTNRLRVCRYVGVCPDTKAGLQDFSGSCALKPGQTCPDDIVDCIRARTLRSGDAAVETASGAQGKSQK